jgi:hypothetical protein
MATKYNIGSKPEDQRKFKLISPDGAPPVKVFDDGSIEAISFVDTTSNDLFFEKYKNKTFYFGEKLDDNTEIQFFPNNVDKVYKTTAKKTFRIKHAFAILEGTVRKFIIEDMDRFKHLPKRVKKTVKQLIADKRVFHFTTQALGQNWANPYIETNQFGPYNYPVKLKVTRDIEMINDVIVVKTGNFENAEVSGPSGQLVTRKIPGKETIVYVSPHEIIEYDAGLDHYCWTGFYDSSGTMPTGTVYSEGWDTFKDRRLGVTNGDNVFGLSSKFITIKSGEYLGNDHDYEYTDLNSTTTLETYSAEVQHTALANYYWKQTQNKVPLSGKWDGIVPSGGYVRIECWSFNPKYAGWDGAISIVDNGTKHLEIDFGADFSGTAISKNYEYSVRNAIKGAEKAAHKKLNDYLVYKGCKSTNNVKKRFDRMLERVAQNIYDDVDFKNNEKLGAMQGTVANPWDSPMYYDGASKAHGGSTYFTNYNYGSAAADKEADIVYYGTGLEGYEAEESPNTNPMSDPWANYTFTDEELGAGGGY